MSAPAYRVAMNYPGKRWEVRVQRVGVSATVWDTLTFDMQDGSWRDGKRLNPDLGAPYWRAFRTGREAIAALLERAPGLIVTKDSRHGWRASTQEESN